MTSERVDEEMKQEICWWVIKFQQ